MERVRVNGAWLEVELSGAGEPVLLVHGSNICTPFAPMLGEVALGAYQLIRYHRRGFANSSPVPEGFLVEQQAADAAALLGELGIGRAHVVGHSYGGAIALQLAIDAPSAVHSLSLLEPPMPAVPGARQFDELIAPAVARYESGERDGVYDDLLLVTGGPNYRRLLEAVLPGAFEQAVEDLDSFFVAEHPSVARWSITAEGTAGITKPTLLMLGSKTGPWFVEGHALLRQWLPDAEVAVVPGAGHLLQITHPRPVAESLAAFLARHPLPRG